MNSTFTNATDPAVGHNSAQAVRVSGLTRRFGDLTAVDAVDFSVETNTITGLLGRNGAGKTTIMQLLTGQDFPTSGDIEVFGQAPAENPAVLSQISFIKESQKYPDDFQPRHVFETAPWFFENWDADFAASLIEDFRLPTKRRIKKLSRGQLSAVGVIVGLASRAPLTFFDEPYLGLDAVARQLFYDRLLADYSEHPRTVILSTHLIDEVADMLERVIVLDQGRIIVDSSAEDLRGSAVTLVGARSIVDGFVAQRPGSTRPVLHRQNLGGLTSVTVENLTEQERREAAAVGIELTPVSLQQLIVRKTTTAEVES